MTKPHLVGILLALFFFAGCGDDSKRVPYAQLGDDAVLVSVGGVSYTKGDVERDARIRGKLEDLRLEMRAPRETEEMLDRFRAEALTKFVDRELLLIEADRRRIVLSEEELNRFYGAFSRRTSDKVRVTYNSVLDRLGPDATAFRNSLRKDAIAAKVSSVLRAENPVTRPSTEEVRKVIAEAKAHNECFAVTNRLACALATNAWKSIVAGNDFAAVGRKLHEMNGFITFVARCSATDPTARGLKKGEITPPLRQEKGLAIFRANEDAPALARHSCIFFALAPVYVIESPDEAAETIYNRTLDEAFERKMDTLRAAADIRFPLGRNPFHD